ncbi:MAG: valine--tRNA ligase, partial [Dehalococcoidia bacterium]
YAFWTQRDYFSPKGDPEKSAFVIIMPPPNVTGELHLGHAIMDACEDILTRWHRMLGEPTLWLPGVDHAGIATQWVVEQQLAQEGLSRHQLGRERFLERVWEWVERHRHLIFEQHQRLGISADWSRLRFTMDPGPSRAVRLTFVNLYRKGLIYRGERIINWCPRCSTALSDLEVTHEETEGRLYYIRYPLESGGHLTVATTRPETMVGDTAVAVNPEDRRYRGLVGQQAILPIIGRGLPVIADVAVDPQFGTGSLKVTPGHDPVDFEIGQRHNLEVVMAIDQQGRMTEAAGPYQGQDRFEARKGIVAQLQREGLLEKEEPYRHAVGRCQRCRTVVEPLVSKQWFISMKPLAEPAIQAVVEGTVSIVPQRFTRVYLNWMENIRDWCISRQLWWGHRIPVWYCQQCGQETVEVDDPSRCTHCRSPQIEQDPDVLDTWFSSALWPHSTLGWEWGPKDIPPGQEQDLARFYPTVAMETGYDILFFWVARMVMMGLQNTGQVPFRYVYLHGLIRDVHGVKMSKTKGNVLDPVQLIEWYGADALRFALTTGTAPGNDLRLGESKLEAARNFANKLWNAARYVMTTLEGADPASLRGWHHLGPLSHREDRWIVSRLNRVIPAVSRYLEGFQLGEAQRELYEFLWGEFCDWYIEMSKVRLRTGQGPSPLLVLAHVLERTLRLLHPFMPFITEEVWQQLVRRLPREGELPESIMVAPYPQADAARLEPQAEEELSLLIQIVKAIRNARAQLRIPLGQRIQALVNAGDARALVEEASEAIKVLARVEPLRLVDSMDAGVSPDRAVTLLVGPLVVLLPLEGLVDLAAERQRLESELAECDTAIARVEALLAKPGFRQRAPDEVVEREEERLRSLQERRERIREFLNRVAR